MGKGNSQNKSCNPLQTFLSTFAKVNVQIPNVVFDIVLLYPLVTEGLQTTIHPNTRPGLQLVDYINIRNDFLSSRLG